MKEILVQNLIIRDFFPKRNEHKNLNVTIERLHTHSVTLDIITLFSDYKNDCSYMLTLVYINDRENLLLQLKKRAVFIA